MIRAASARDALVELARAGAITGLRPERAEELFAHGLDEQGCLVHEGDRGDVTASS